MGCVILKQLFQYWVFQCLSISESNFLVLGGILPLYPRCGVHSSLVSSRNRIVNWSWEQKLCWPTLVYLCICICICIWMCILVKSHCQLILRAKTVLTHACIFVYLYLYLNVYFGEVALSIDLGSKNCVDPRSKLLHLSDKLSCQTKLYLYVQYFPARLTNNRENRTREAKVDIPSTRISQMAKSLSKPWSSIDMFRYFTTVYHGHWETSKGGEHIFTKKCAASE